MDMTDQEIYDKVKAHLLKQGRRSIAPCPGVNNVTKCVYRTEDGRSCAVGCLIPDEVYQPQMDYGAGFSIISLAREPGLEWFGKHINLLESLQHVHDTADVDDDGNFVIQPLVIRLEMIALRFGLRG